MQRLSVTVKSSASLIIALRDAVAHPVPLCYLTRVSGMSQSRPVP